MMMPSLCVCVSWDGEEEEGEAPQGNGLDCEKRRVVVVVPFSNETTACWVFTVYSAVAGKSGAFPNHFK